MKMRSNTSTTSTSGMMLISAMVPPMRRLSPPASRLNAIFGDAGDLGGGPSQQVEELEGEAVHLRRPVLHPVDEVVVPDDRGNRRSQTGRRGDESLRYARS